GAGQVVVDVVVGDGPVGADELLCAVSCGCSTVAFVDEFAVVMPGVPGGLACGGAGHAGPTMASRPASQASSLGRGFGLAGLGAGWWACPFRWSAGVDIVGPPLVGRCCPT